MHAFELVYNRMVFLIKMYAFTFDFQYVLDH